MSRLSLKGLVRRYDSALTPGRLRMHAVVLAAGLWITAIYTLATPGAFDRNGLLKGIDFLQFHTAGRLVWQGNAARLYDWHAFADELKRTVPGTGELLFVSVYPPQLAIALAPLGAMPYLPAVAIWMLVSAAIYAVCVRAFAPVLPEVKRAGLSWVLLALAFGPFFQLIVHGQVGVLVLAGFTAAWLALRRERWFLAGLALGSLCFKPQFLTAAVIAVLVMRSAAVAAGAAAGASLQIVLVTAALGHSIWLEYFEKVRIMLRLPEAFEPKPWQMHNLKGFWRLLLGPGEAAVAAWLLSAALVAIAVLLIARKTRSPELRISLIVIATVMLNPHLYVYDLVVLAVPLAALVRWLLDTPGTPEAPAVRVLLHLLWWAPLVGPLAMLTRVQVTPILFAALLWTLWRALNGSGAPAPPTVRPESV